jgi:hypothetical protein
MKNERCQVRPVPLDNPLNELARQQAFRRDVPVLNVGKELRLDPLALGLRMGWVSFDFGLTTASSEEPGVYTS